LNQLINAVAGTALDLDTDNNKVGVIMTI
jgi:hypothetical protein